MFERFITDLQTDDAGVETPAQTRDRLKGCFAPGAVRRMTQIGMLVGAALGRVAPQKGEALVYASQFGESRSLENYLDSFPAASPTLFQTSIHPSGVQQGLIGRQCSLGEVLPMAGMEQLPMQALLTAMLAPSESAVLCGGEERGTWLVDFKSAAERTYGYAFRLARAAGATPLGRLTITPTDDDGVLEPDAWFDLLRRRSPFEGPAALGWRLKLIWS